MKILSGFGFHYYSQLSSIISSSLQIETRRISIRSNLSSSPLQTLILMDRKAPIKLRRLPHVFGKTLELPIRSDADVDVQESPEFIRFTVEVGNTAGDVRAHVVEIHPGVTKVVVRSGRDRDSTLLMDRLKMDAWRFRLPASTRPELAVAEAVGGKIVVTVPKRGPQDLELSDRRVLPKLLFAQ